MQCELFFFSTCVEQAWMCIMGLLHLPSSASPLHQRLKISDNLEKDELQNIFSTLIT